MSSLFKFQMMIWILIVFLVVSGIGTSTHQLAEVTGLLDNPENIQTSTLWIAILAIFAVGAGAAIVIGIYSRANVKDVVIATYLTTSTIFFAIEFIDVIVWTNAHFADSSTWGWMTYLVTGLFGMLTIGYLAALVDFYQGGT